MPLQHNTYDCGVWVLAFITAVLRGFNFVRLSSSEITEFRLRILSLVYYRAGVVL